MDLLSLPEEMLSSVVKYVDNTTMTKCRRLSSKIDAIAVKYRLNEVELKYLVFIVFDSRIMVKIKDFEGNETNHSVEFLYGFGDEVICAFVQNYYTKARYIESFEIFSRVNNAFILPTRLINMMIERSKGRQISQLSFAMLTLEWDSSLMRRFLTTFKLKKMMLVTCRIPNLGKHNSLFNGLSFDVLDLPIRPELSLNDLKTICKTKVPQQLDANCEDVTLRDVFELLKNVLDRKQQKLSMILYNVDFDGITREEQLILFQSLGKIDYLSYNNKFIEITYYDKEIKIVLFDKSIIW